MLLTDGDLQFDLAELERFAAARRATHDLVAGYRIARADPLLRRAAAHAWNRLMRRSFGVDVRDVDCAFKLVRGRRCARSGWRATAPWSRTELLVARGAARAGASPRSACTTGRASRASPAGGDPRVVLRAFRERRALLRRLRARARGGRAGAARPTAA